jgi:hypothetical protein
MGSKFTARKDETQTKKKETKKQNQQNPKTKTDAAYIHRLTS